MEPPDENVESVTPMRPCTWNSGITTIATSSEVRLYVSRIFLSEAARLPCVSGTPLGRLVVPEVCRNSAVSSVDGSFAANLGMEKIGVNFAVGHNDFTITLPSPVDQDGKSFIIKDASGNVDGGEDDRIIINCSAGAVLQGGIEEAVIEVGNGSFEFVSNGSQWLILNDN